MANAPEYEPNQEPPQIEAQQLTAAVNAFFRATPDEKAAALKHPLPPEAPPEERGTTNSLVDALAPHPFPHARIKDLLNAMRVVALQKGGETEDTGTTRRALLLRAAADLVVGVTAVLTAKEIFLQNLARVFISNPPKENQDEKPIPFFTFYEGQARGPVTDIPHLVHALNNHDGEFDPARFLLGTDPFTIHDPYSVFNIPGLFQLIRLCMLDRNMLLQKGILGA
jgi:hypothetical protein